MCGKSFILVKLCALGRTVRHLVVNGQIKEFPKSVDHDFWKLPG